MNAFVTKVWGKDVAVSASEDMEYMTNTDARVDPFAAIHGVSSEYDDMVQADGTIMM